MPDEQLCQACRRIVEGPGPMGPTLNVHLEYLAEPCAICSYLLRLLEIKRTASSNTFPTHGPVYVEFRLGLPPPYRWSISSACPTKLYYDVWEHHKSPSPPAISICIEQLSPQKCESEQEQDIVAEANDQRGNDCSNEFDAKRARNWLDECQKNHKKCRIDPQTPELPRGMLLINVNSNSIAEAPPSARYIALSYVWGTAVTLKTTRANLPDLQVAGSLLPFGQGSTGVSIPEVVLDAIRVVRRLGERYLWVDALCIVQDDPVSKHSQINNMDIIYSRAIVTLAAVSGKDANGCLFNTSSSWGALKTIPPLDIIGLDIRIRPAVPHLEPILGYSVYDSRGWTFQERILSPRMLLFTEYGVFYSCEKSTTHETQWPCDPDTMYSERDVNPFLDIRYTPEFTVPSTKEMFDTYTDLVEMYTQRQLTFESDIGNAFAGILNALDRIYSFKTLHGLPRKRLAAALAWTPEVSSSRRSRATSNLSAPEVSFPSWSWQGWTGRISYRTLIGKVSSEYWEIRPEISLIDTGLKGFLFSPVLTRREANLRKTFPDDILKRLISFSALVVDGEEFSLEVLQKSGGKESSFQTAIRDRNDQECGELSSFHVDITRPISRQALHLVLICQIHWTEGTLRKHNEDNNWHLVLLIQSLGELAERLATGRMRRAGWNRLRAKRRIVRLV